MNLNNKKKIKIWNSLHSYVFIKIIDRTMRVKLFSTNYGIMRGGRDVQAFFWGGSNVFSIILRGVKWGVLKFEGGKHRNEYNLPQIESFIVISLTPNFISNYVSKLQWIRERALKEKNSTINILAKRKSLFLIQ